MIKKRLNPFHKAIIIFFIVQVTIVTTEIVKREFFNEITIGVIPAFLFIFSPILILLLFITGCIQAKVKQKGTTINYYVLMLILLFNTFFLATILWMVIVPAIIIFGLTRKYWEVKPIEKPQS